MFNFRMLTLTLALTLSLTLDRRIQEPSGDEGANTSLGKVFVDRPQIRADADVDKSAFQAKL